MAEQHASRILGPRGSDAGCDRSLELVDELVDLELAGEAMRDSLREVAKHLAACPDCGEDYEGIRTLARKQHSPHVGAADDPEVLEGDDPG